MGAIVYLMCSLTSLLCVGFQVRGYRAKPEARILLWSSICFAGLAITNLILFVDLVLIPETDLLLWRNITSAVGLGVLIYGLVFDYR